MITFQSMASVLKDHPVDLSRNRLLGGRVMLAQPVQGYRVAIDPVLLAAAVPAAAGDRVLDAGCGAGAAGLCLAARIPGCLITGVEIDPAFVALARDNAAANGFSDRIAIRAGDIGRDWPEGAALATFDHAMTNPPHLDPARSTIPALGGMARAEGRVGLVAWIGALLNAVRPRGTITLVHRADRLDDILAALHGRAGGVVVYPLWPKAARAAKRVIVQARRGSRAAMTVKPGLVLHETDGRFTVGAENVLRHAAGLPVADPA